MNIDPNKELLTSEEVAIKLGVSASAVRKWIELKKIIPLCRVGKRILFSKDIQKPLRKGKTEPTDVITDVETIEELSEPANAE